ncbi:hypothetical protein QFZ23_002110 [Arthrobacter globiformis]|nr:hypothetical protein [Arthrobacter globiformis]
MDRVREQTDNECTVRPVPPALRVWKTAWYSQSFGSRPYLREQEGSYGAVG